MQVAVETFGGPEALAVHEVAEPHAGAGSVRIRVQAFAVNPTDTGVRAGERDSTEASPAYAQELVAPVGSFTRSLRGTSVEAASTVPVNGLTALQILSFAGLSRGDTLAVTGAAALLGNYVVQLAVAAGLTVIADAAPADEALDRSHGPAHIVPRGDGFAAAVRALVPDGVDARADAAVLRRSGLSWSMLFGTGRVPGAGMVGERRSWNPVRAGRGVLGAPVVRQARAAASCGRRRNGGARLPGGASSVLSTPWANHQSGAAKSDQRAKERRQRIPDRHSESYQRALLPDSRLGKGARGARLTKTDSIKDERVHPGLPRNERR